MQIIRRRIIMHGEFCGPVLSVLFSYPKDEKVSDESSKRKFSCSSNHIKFFILNNLSFIWRIREKNRMEREIFLLATKWLHKRVCPSVGPSIRPRVMLSLFGLLGATQAVYTALFTDARMRPEEDESDESISMENVLRGWPRCLAAKEIALPSRTRG